MLRCVDGLLVSVARLDWLDVNLFLTQMASISQLCGDLMLADLESIKWAPELLRAAGEARTRPDSRITARRRDCNVQSAAVKPEAFHDLRLPARPF